MTYSLSEIRLFSFMLWENVVGANSECAKGFMKEIMVIDKTGFGKMHHRNKTNNKVKKLWNNLNPPNVGAD